MPLVVLLTSVRVLYASVGQCASVEPPLSRFHAIGRDLEALRTLIEYRETQRMEGVPIEGALSSAVRRSTTFRKRPSASAKKVSASNAIMGLNVQDYGADPTGETDSTESFQIGINAAITGHRTLLVPAGHYRVNDTLQVSLLNGKIRIVGEGKYNTFIIASANSGEAMPRDASSFFAIFNISYTEPFDESTNVEMSDFTLEIGDAAEYGIYAPLLTRSYFNDIFFDGGTIGGMLLGGWINVISQCSFNGAHSVALFMAGNNMIVDSSSFEGNEGDAIQLPWGNQVTIANSVLEGNVGTAIRAAGCSGLSVRSCYFEENCRSQPCNFSIDHSNPDLSPNSSAFVDIILSAGKHSPTIAAEVLGCTFCPHTRGRAWH